MDSLEVRGLTFPYRASGPADGREVLLLHGFPQFSLEWAAQLEALGGVGLPRGRARSAWLRDRATSRPR